MARLLKVLVVVVVLGSVAALLASRREKAAVDGPFVPPKGSFDTWPDVPSKPGS